MKYQNLYAFEQFIKGAQPSKLPRLFLIVSPCSYERRRIVEGIVKRLSSEGEGTCFFARDAGEEGLRFCLEEANTASLFSKTKVLYLNEIEKLKKGELAPLLSYVENPSCFSYLILGASSSKGLSELSSKLTSCDLSGEKPWEKRGRLKKMLVEYAASYKKVLTAEAVEWLLERVETSLPHLEREVDKLVTFAFTREKITLADAQTLSTSQKEPPFWEKVDALLWGEKPSFSREEIDFGLLLPLISHLRAQLQQALMVSLCVASGMSRGEIEGRLPSLRASALEKLLSHERRREPLFFRRALDLLFEMELMAKNSSLEPGWILDLFSAKLWHLKRGYAPSSS